MAPHLICAVLGLVIGCALGYAARRGLFCTFGALEDAVYGGDTRRLRAWALAIAMVPDERWNLPQRQKDMRPANWTML